MLLTFGEVEQRSAHDIAAAYGGCASAEQEVIVAVIAITHDDQLGH